MYTSRGYFLLKSSFALSSAFTAIAGAWLAIMETLLRHSGYQGRITVDLLIALQGIIAVLACRALHPAVALRSVLLVSAVGLAYVGTAALVRLVHASHFEGFVILIGIAIILQAGLTAAVMLRPRLLL